MTNNGKPQKLILTEKVLGFMASLVLKKYNPRVIGITGSVGKTSTKEAVFSVLARYYRVRRNEKNYNNEVGLPLTVIGTESGESSLWGWLRVFLKWLAVIILPVEYPEILILEMAADRPGDIKYLTDLVRPKIGIITDISGSHMEFLKDIEGIAKEKGDLVKFLGKDGVAILNADNIYAMKLKNQIKCPAVTFGFFDEADIQASDVHYNYAENGNENGKAVKGLSFKLNHKGTTIPMRLNNILAEHNVYAALAAVAVALEFKLNLVEIGTALEDFSLPFGRMNLVSGIKNTIIIDDTYNASPVSTMAALDVMRNIKASRKIAVLGDMLELGKEMESGHRSVAKKFAGVGGDIFFAVGCRMQFAADELKKHNISEDRIFVFKNPMEAGRKLQEIIREGDLILIKGSQGMRMEMAVEEIMAEPQRAGSLLCRQTRSWKEKPWKEV